jgi:soluble lytic murein transglycosylase-like protein
MKIKKKQKQAVKRTGLIALLFCGLLLMILFLSHEELDMNDRQYAQPVINESVKDYQPLVEKYAKKNGVDNYVDTLLAIMMQESGGRGNDPMQSSESYCGSRGCINDPKISIKQGVQHFANVLDKADGDLKLAIQSYNFGGGFIDYVQKRSEGYSEAIAIDFSREMYENAPNKQDYSCLRAGAEEYEACYGDIYYVKSVMNYQEVIAGE